MQQLVQPNLNAVGRIGWCLEYVSRGVYFNPAPGTNAWNAWQATQYKHTDPIPTDVSVPCWFSYTATIEGVRANYGHVVAWVPGRGFYSSPWQAGTTHAVLSSIAEVEKTYTTRGPNGELEPVKYVGWSEDILGKRIVEGGTQVSTIGEVEFNNLYIAFFGPMEVNPPTEGDRKRWIGAESNTVIRAMQADPRHNAWLAYIDDLKKNQGGGKYKVFTGTLYEKES